MAASTLRAKHGLLVRCPPQSPTADGAMSGLTSRATAPVTTQPSPNRMWIPTTERKIGLVEGISIPAMSVVASAIMPRSALCTGRDQVCHVDVAFSTTVKAKFKLRHHPRPGQCSGMPVRGPAGVVSDDRSSARRAVVAFSDRKHRPKRLASSHVCHAMTSVAGRSSAGGSPRPVTGLLLRGLGFALLAAILFARSFFTTSAIFCMTAA